jgi:hypothetical protein
VTLKTAFVDKLSNLSRKSVRDHYNPYTHFDWPDALAEDQLSMPAELLSIDGVPSRQGVAHPQRL